MLCGALISIYLSLDLKIPSWCSGCCFNAFNQIFCWEKDLFNVNIKISTDRQRFGDYYLTHAVN